MTALALVCGALASAQAQTDNDFEIRSRLNLNWSFATNWTAITWAELRWLNDASEMSNWRIAQQLQYQISEYLLSGVGYTCIRQDGIEPFSGTDLDTTTHRFELELTPGFNIGDDLRLQCRLRSEYLHTDEGDDSTRIRIRPELVWPLHHCGRLKEFRASNEFFVRFEDGQRTQNRAIPVSFGFELGPAAELRLQYVLDSTLMSQGWVNAHALQTHVIISFH